MESIVYLVRGFIPAHQYLRRARVCAVHVHEHTLRVLVIVALARFLLSSVRIRVRT
jgi:hypothetical protein